MTIRFCIRPLWLAVGLCCLFAWHHQARAQGPFEEGQIIDRVVAVVGDKAILQSELEAQRSFQQQAFQQNQDISGDCQGLKQYIRDKLLLTQAAEDSLQIGEQRLDSELERRMQYYVRQFGSESRLESYYDATVEELKERFRPLVRDQLLIQQMQQQLVGELNVSPQDVRQYYHSIPKDSLPLISLKVRLRQIVQYPKPTEAAKETARRRLQSLRERILEGESFSTLAILYSEDEGSASRGGEIGFENRNNLAPAYANTAFKLEVDSVSEVVETKFGLHIIQLLERRGERVNTRHILIKPELDGEARIAVKHKLDSIRNLIRQGKIAFSQAAFRFSEDDETRNNGGLMTTARDNSTKLPADELKAGLYFAVDTMKEGQISPPMPMQGRDGRTAYRLVKLEKRFPPHKASLKLDYPELKRKAEQEQRQAYLDEWMQKQLKQTYLKVMPPYHRCPSLQGLRASGSSAANMPPGR